MTTKARYQAPALTKGLEILELLAASSVPLTMSDVSTALGRSVSEIFRMLQVLEAHRYIARGDDGYRLTNRLFALSMGQPPVRDLVSTALPVMRTLARQTGQSCHLVVVSGAEIVVIAGVEAPGLSGFAVRVGYRRPLHRSASGRILLAFQPEDTRAAMLDEVRATGDTIDDEVAALSGLTGQRPHHRQRGRDEIAHRRLSHAEREQPVGEPIAVVAARDVAMRLEHLQHAENLADRAAERGRDVRHGERHARRGEQLEDFEPLGQCGRLIAHFGRHMPSPGSSFLRCGLPPFFRPPVTPFPGHRGGDGAIGRRRVLRPVAAPSHLVSAQRGKENPQMKVIFTFHIAAGGHRPSVKSRELRPFVERVGEV
jgi:DNA-binding IclR family transcriptional regulator